MNKFENLKPEYKIWFSSLQGDGILGDGKWKILKQIDECGSLVGACEQLGITYRRTWNDLRKIEKMLGFQLLETVRGGVEGQHDERTEPQRVRHAKEPCVIELGEPLDHGLVERHERKPKEHEQDLQEDRSAADHVDVDRRGPAEPLGARHLHERERETERDRQREGDDYHDDRDAPRPEHHAPRELDDRG